MTRALVALLAILRLTACTPGQRQVLPPLTERGEAERLVTRGDEAARAGDARGARRLYEQVLREHADGPAAPQALYGIAMLQVDPGPNCDYRAARVTFDRLVASYPHSPWAREAGAWRAALKELERCEADAAKVRADLERLKELDFQLEQRP